MLTGKKFRRERFAFALELVDGHRMPVASPAGDNVEVVSDPRSQEQRRVEACWEGEALGMFVLDVDVRTEIAEPQRLRLIPMAKQAEH